MYISENPIFRAIYASIFLMITSTIALAVTPDIQASKPFDAALQADKKAEKVKYKPDELLVKFKTKIETNKLNTLTHLSGVGISSTNLDILSAKQFNVIKNNNKLGMQNKLGVQNNNQTNLDNWNNWDNWWHIKLAKGTDLQRALNILSSRQDIEFVEYNYEIRTLVTPNDPHFDSLWGLHNTQQTGGVFDADIDASEAWDSNTGDANIIIAVIDTGVDYGHEDLAGNMWKNPGEIAGNLIDDDGNGYVDDVHGYDFSNTDSDPFDDHGHGTHVSGTIAGVGNNGIGVVGVNWNAKIMAVKFLGAGGGGYVSDAIDGVIYAVNNGAKILNNSWGGGGFSQALLEVIYAANDAGVLFVTAAGNKGRNNDIRPYYPSSYVAPNMISVAATDHNDQLAVFSSYGASTVHLGAPGVKTLSTVPTGSCPMCSRNGYREAKGTSMATPHVSGAAALLLDRMPMLSIGGIKSRLMNSTDQISALSGVTISGGRLNIAAALAYKPNISVTIAPLSQSVLPGETATYTVTITSLGNTTEQISLSLDSLDIGITASLADTRLTPPIGGSITTTLTVTAASNIARGYFFVQIQAADDIGQIFSSTAATLRVLRPDVDISISPSKQEVSPGGSTTYDVVFTSIDGFSSAFNISTVPPHSSISMNMSPTQVILQADGTAVATISASTSTTTPIQLYTFTVTASDAQSTRGIDAQLHVLDTDLVMTALSTSSTDVNTGETIMANSTITNQGTSDTTTTFYIGYYLSSDATITTADTQIGSRYIYRTAAGASFTRTTSVTIPSDLAIGTYYLGAIADHTDRQIESNEDNNVRVAATPLQVIEDVDLVISSVSTPDSQVYRGAPISVTHTIHNAGGSPTDSGSWVGIYLSSDATITTADTRIGSRYIFRMAAGVSFTRTISFIIPSSLAVGTYYLGAIADDTDLQTESNEDNNVRVATTPLQVSQEVDLVISSVSTPDNQVYRGAPISVTHTIHNAGGSPTDSGSWVGIYLSSDATITTADTRIGSRYISRMAAGVSFTRTISFIIPSSLAVGTYYLGAIADDTDLQTESNEDNNGLTATIPLSID
ncbi:Serine protease, subtilase family [hydrothermal vent metagenome]|uniref:Serine protease, subtilase family n=1 Tax=hydrothermal vent metagenome TaxID=652676 RepID=A0A3B1B3S1_9ZZZZ